MKFLKYLERWEYHQPSSFWGIAVGGYFIFNLCTGQFVSSFTINSQFPDPSVISSTVTCRGGDGFIPLPTTYQGSPPTGAGDRGADREIPVSPRYGSTAGEDGSGGGSDGENSWDQEEVPPESDYQTDSKYWEKYHPYLQSKKNVEETEDEEEGTCLAQNKGGFDDLLIDLPGHRYQIEGASSRKELTIIAKDSKARKFLTNGLGRIKDGTITAIQQKELKGFEHLKEYKFGRRGVRVLVNPGKHGEPDAIVAIVRRDQAKPFIKSLRTKFETTK